MDFTEEDQLMKRANRGGRGKNLPLCLTKYHTIVLSCA